MRHINVGKPVLGTFYRIKLIIAINKSQRSHIQWLTLAKKSHFIFTTFAFAINFGCSVRIYGEL